ncbi:glycine oxidase ThiO [Jatrophihabitans sp. DSM 45814]
MPVDTPDVIVVGGGVIGLAAAYRMADSGAKTVIIDASGARGSSWAAAGMLAPISEAVFGEENLTRLNLAAVAEFASFADALETRTGKAVGLRREGTLALALTADDRSALDRLTEFRDALGLKSEALSGRAARALEPYLAADVRGGVLAVDDLSVDNRRYLDALQRAGEIAGVRTVADQVTALHRERGRVTGVITAEHGRLHASSVVLCTGAMTAKLVGCPIEPVKGQILRLHVPARLTAAGPVLTRTVRGIVRGSEIYLVPRSDGEVVVGATQEHQGFDTTVTAGGVYELLRNAYELVPISSEFEFVEACAGLRPGTPDNGPLLGYVEDGLIVASGHYRNGVLLSAMTATAVTQLVAGGSVAEEWKPFHPDRFATTTPAGITECASP